MTNTKARVEQRKHKRFRVQDGAFVILRPTDTGVGRLIDISMGGLTFDYVTRKAPSIEATELDIFLTDSDFRLYEFPCQSVWDLITYEIPTTAVHKRRCGVQFGELTQSQVFQLEHFIQNYTTGPA